MNSLLPAYYYPSTHVFIDDDPLFLKTVTHLFEGQKLITFSSPEDALNFFNSYSCPLSEKTFLRGAIEDERYELANHSPVELDVPSLHTLYFSPERQEEISVIIVDQEMGQMKGLELCKKLSEHSFKKILLTGTVDPEEAVAAFNNTTIDRFIRKDHPNLANEIKKHVLELSKEYFVEKTKNLVTHLEAHHKLILSDNHFIKFFHQHCEQNSIHEFYIIDKNGSLMLVNDKEQISYLIIHTDKSLSLLVELHKENAEANTFIGKVISREFIPFFGVGKESWEHDISEWNNYFYPAQTIQGREKYYYTHIE